MAIPVSLEQAKEQLAIIDDASRDVQIEGYIADAAAWVEEYTGHLLVARDVTETFRGYRVVTLKAWPIAPDAAVGVAYVDSAGMPIALPGARLDVSSGRARVLPGSGIYWPFRDTEQLFTITVRAGYEDGDVVPGNIRRAMLVLIAAYHGDREGGAMFQAAERSARSLCRCFRRWTT